MISRLTDADGTTTSYDYDAGRNLISVTDPPGEVHPLPLRSGRRPDQRDPPSGATTSWARYDANRVTPSPPRSGTSPGTATRRPGGWWSSSTPAGTSIRYRYDAAGHRTSVTDPLGTGSRTATTRRDNNVTRPRPPATRDVRLQRPRPGYHDHRPGTRTRQSSTTRTGTRHHGHPRRHVHRRTYDGRGNKTAVTDPGGFHRATRMTPPTGRSAPPTPWTAGCG